MYVYQNPTPIVIDLSGEDGFELRKKALAFVEKLKVRGKESGSSEEQTYGVLAQMAIRQKLGLPIELEENQGIGFDLLLPPGVKVDIKCRGGTLPFKENYVGSGGLEREAKHNFFARQLVDARLETDIYLMTHLETPKPMTRGKTPLPGTPRQRKWILYVCGWVSKIRVKNEGVYLPRGAITEQGGKWFPYRGQEVEFYNRYLNGLRELKDILSIDFKDVEKDAKEPMHLHLTSVDAIRIGIDLVGYGIINKETLDFLKHKLEIKGDVPPILNPNQYHRLLKWLETQGKVDKKAISNLTEIMKEVEYKGD
jgi:hypothetical protein